MVSIRANADPLGGAAGLDGLERIDRHHGYAVATLDARWSGRICTWPVLTTDTRRIGSVASISMVLPLSRQRPA